MVGLKYKFISSFKYAAKSTVHESLYFESLLAEFVCWYGWVGLVVGVCGFLSWGICGLVVGVGVVLCFCLRKFFWLCLKGSVVWWVVFEELFLDFWKWFFEYMGVLMWRVVFLLFR